MKRQLRKAARVVRVISAAAGGAVFRFVRRLARRKPRIWHGFYPIHSLHDLVEIDRHLRYPTRSVIYSSQQVGYPLVWDELFDVVLDSRGVPWNELHWVTMTDMLWRADIWVTNFDCLFFAWHDRRNVWAMRLLKSVGIRIIVAPHGGDIVQLWENSDRYRRIERMARDYPEWDFREQTEISRARVSIFSRFADLVISGDYSLDPFLPRRDLRFKYFPIDTREITPAPAKPSAPVPVIVHAPNHRYVKGSYELIAAVERLQARGIACELQLVEKVKRSEALRIYAGADVIADQFIIGAYGTFALEGLALEKPVLTYLDQDHLRDPVFNLPLVNTTLENMDNVLAVLLQVPELRSRLGAAGRAAVERYQSIDALAEVWDRLYRHVWWGAPLQLEQTRHFTPARGARSTTEDPSSAEFWPVDVSDLMPEIESALSRL
ncbi:MAG TPA: glycosyltransferase [Thermoanaerobaculia bacterium]|nr:glycosyltransferase [Thermoanaerobaculia bacterium]